MKAEEFKNIKIFTIADMEEAFKNGVIYATKPFPSNVMFERNCKNEWHLKQMLHISNDKD